MPTTTQNFTTTLKSIVVHTCWDIYSHKNSPLPSSTILHSQIKRGQTADQSYFFRNQKFWIVCGLTRCWSHNWLFTSSWEGGWNLLCLWVGLSLIISIVITYSLTAFLLTGWPLWCPNISPWAVCRGGKYEVAHQVFTQPRNMTAVTF